jgi:WD40 repeat protein
MTASQAAGDMLNAITFTRSGGILITGDQDGVVRLWDVTTFQEIGPAIVAESPDPVFGMAISPNGDMLATVGNYKDAAQLWDIAFPADLMPAVCNIAGSSITRSEWNSYTQSRPYQKIC